MWLSSFAHKFSQLAATGTHSDSKCRKITWSIVRSPTRIFSRRTHVEFTCKMCRCRMKPCNFWLQVWFVLSLRTAIKNFDDHWSYIKTRGPSSSQQPQPLHALLPSNKGFRQKLARVGWNTVQSIFEYLALIECFSISDHEPLSKLQLAAFSSQGFLTGNKLIVRFPELESSSLYFLN